MYFFFWNYVHAFNIKLSWHILWEYLTAYYISHTNRSSLNFWKKVNFTLEFYFILPINANFINDIYSEEARRGYESKLICVFWSCREGKIHHFYQILCLNIIHVQLFNKIVKSHVVYFQKNFVLAFSTYYIKRLTFLQPSCCSQTLSFYICSFGDKCFFRF